MNTRSLTLAAGNLDKRISLQSPTQTRTADGGVTESFEEEAEVWAEIKPVSAREHVSGNQITQDITHKIKIRYYSGITPSWRIVFDSRVFNIHSVINAKELNVYHEILCKEQL